MLEFNLQAEEGARVRWLRPCLVRAEEASLVRQVVVAPRVVRPRAAPLDVPRLRPRPGQVAQRALVVALKLADACKQGTL